MNSEVTERNLPAGTVTFLFTDIQGSTKLLQQLGDHTQPCYPTSARSCGPPLSIGMVMRSTPKATPSLPPFHAPPRL